VGANLLLFYILSSQNRDIVYFSRKKEQNRAYLCCAMQEIIQCIDAGNTAIKLGVFKQNELQEVHRFDSFETLSKYLSSEYPIVLASVREDDFAMQLKENFSVYEITPQSKTSFLSLYQNNLGADRLCNVAAMYARMKKNNDVGGGITVDIGTCVKFDYLDEAFNYVGGSISPGISLRLKSLNDYTARLPLLIAPDHQASLYGNTTSSSIYSGVMGGIKGEIEARIAEFRKLNANMAVFITGGDAHYFDFEQKNGIFADENLTLKGIHEIYVFNALHS
jgi:type III pantothenate kinase